MASTEWKSLTDRLVKMNLLVGVCQMTSKGDKEANFAVCQSLIEKAKQRGVQVHIDFFIE
jgi:hypothetical protein